MNIYLMSTVKLNLVEFHSGTSTLTSQTLHLSPTCQRYSCWLTHTRMTYMDKMCVLIMH